MEWPGQKGTSISLLTWNIPKFTGIRDASGVKYAYNISLYKSQLLQPVMGFSTQNKDNINISITENSDTDVLIICWVGDNDTNTCITGASAILDW